MTNAVLLVCDDCRNQEDKDDNFCTSCGYKLVNFHSSLEKEKQTVCFIIKLETVHQLHL